MQLFLLINRHDEPPHAHENMAIEDLKVRDDFFFFNHLLNKCPFHNQRPDKTIIGKNPHWMAKTARGIFCTGP